MMRVTARHYILLLIFVIVVFALALGGSWFEVRYADRFYPGVFIGNEAVGGKTYAEVLEHKDNCTIKELGGGLCQIATTLFRLALNAGLPITERVNHSYIAFYYGTPGLDATTYSPKPDLRFVGETKQQNFHSIYKPWRKICLVGVGHVEPK